MQFRKSCPSPNCVVCSSCQVYLESNPGEVFVHLSPTRCWEMVKDRVNQEISKQHKAGKSDLPPLQPSGSPDGFEMFGYSSPAIVQVNLCKFCIRLRFICLLIRFSNYIYKKINLTSQYESPTFDIFSSFENGSFICKSS